MPKTHRSDVYSASFFAKMIGADTRTVQTWCRNGVIRASRQPGNNHWRISRRSIFDFMHQNPRYLERMKKRMNLFPFCNEKKKSLCNSILEEMDSRVKVYSARMIADRLGVDFRATRYWVKKGWMTPLEERSATRDTLFTETEVMRFLDSHPKYKDIWEETTRYEC